MMCWRQLYANIIAVEVDLIVERGGRLGRFGRVMPVFPRRKTDLGRDEHLAVARPAYAGNMQLAEASDKVVLVVAVLTAARSLRRGIDRPVRKLRTDDTVAVAAHAHEKVDIVYRLLRPANA